MSLLINRRDLDFVLYELLKVDALATTERYAGQDRDLYDATIDAAERLATDKFATHAAELDEHEPTFDGERVHLIPAVKEALDAYVEAGFMGASLDADIGGMQLRGRSRRPAPRISMPRTSRRQPIPSSRSRRPTC